VTLDVSSVNLAWVSVFLLLLSRSGGWLVTMPLFGARGAATVGRLAFSIGLAVVLTPVALPHANIPTDLGSFAVANLTQFLAGALMGWLSGLLLNAPAVAGSIADLTSGLGYASLIDPASGQQAATFSRLFSITFSALLLATGAYQVIIIGFARSLAYTPIGSDLPVRWAAGGDLASTVTLLMRAGVEIAAPLLGTLLLTDVALALASKFFPQANVTFLGLGLKALLALFGAGAVMVLLPGHLDWLLSSGDDLLRKVLG